MQRRGARKLILTVQVVMCFIVGLGSYDPREGKGFQLVSTGFVLEIMCVQPWKWEAEVCMSNPPSAQINHTVILMAF